MHSLEKIHGSPIAGSHQHHHIFSPQHHNDEREGTAYLDHQKIEALLTEAPTRPLTIAFGSNHRGTVPSRSVQYYKNHCH
jgi:hypothetical protein